MVIFNSYVKLPEGKNHEATFFLFILLKSIESGLFSEWMGRFIQQW